MSSQVSFEHEVDLIRRAQEGDKSAFDLLTEPLRRPLFSYIYRMVTNRGDAEDLLQDTLMRALESLSRFRGEAKFKTWLFSIATHVCLDHLRSRKRWSVESQLEGEREADTSPEQLERLSNVMSQPDFLFEIREHIAFCFSCISRTLPPEEQAAIMLKEVLGLTAQEAARIMEVSEPIFRHRLSSARSQMTRSYEGLCQLINKTGLCHQCQGLREFAPENHRGSDLVQITVAPGKSVTPEALFDARLEIVRESNFAEGTMREMHDWFFEGINQREESRA
jgi:RNA polymerase sigma-70 factor (ECF subfamily)